MLKDGIARFNSASSRLMWAITPAGLIIGLLLGDRISSFAFLGEYLFMVLTFSGAVSMQARDFANVMKHPKDILVFLIVGKAVIPLSCVFLIKLAMPDAPEYALGYALVLTGPVAVSSFIWSGIYAGNASLTMTIVMVDTLITPLSMPFFVKMASGATIAIDAGAMIISLCRIVLIPMVIGVAANEISGNKLKSEHGACFSALGKAALISSLVLNSSKISNAAASLRLSDWPLVAAAILAVAFSLIGGYLICLLMGIRSDNAVSLTMGCGLKNNTASLVIATTSFSPATAIPVFFIIMFQQITCSGVSALLFGDRIKEAQSLGEAAAEAEAEGKAGKGHEPDSAAAEVSSSEGGKRHQPKAYLH